MGLGSVMSAVDGDGSAALPHDDRSVPTYMSPSRLNESVGVAAEHAISLKYSTRGRSRKVIPQTALIEIARSKRPLRHPFCSAAIALPTLFQPTRGPAVGALKAVFVLVSKGLRRRHSTTSLGIQLSRALLWTSTKRRDSYRACLVPASNEDVPRCACREHLAGTALSSSRSGTRHTTQWTFADTQSLCCCTLLYRTTSKHSHRP